MGEQERKHRLPAGVLSPEAARPEDLGSAVRPKLPPSPSYDAGPSEPLRQLLESIEEADYAFLARTRDPSLLQPLRSLVLDESRHVRRSAIRLLRAYEGDAGYPPAVAELRLVASYPGRASDDRRRAIAALSQLRDQSSIGMFIELLGEPDRRIAAAARVGLQVLTGHDFGFARDPWGRWARREHRKDRVQWLIEALGDARGHLRALASRELAQLTGLRGALAENSPRSAFVTEQRAYQAWWAARSQNGA